LPYEFDLIINMDTIRDTAAADAIAILLESRFSEE
jgi:hypothetical protein